MKFPFLAKLFQKKESKYEYPSLIEKASNYLDPPKNEYTHNLSYIDSNGMDDPKDRYNDSELNAFHDKWWKEAKKEFRENTHHRPYPRPPFNDFIIESSEDKQIREKIETLSSVVMTLKEIHYIHSESHLNPYLREAWDSLTEKCLKL